MKISRFWIAFALLLPLLGCKERTTNNEVNAGPVVERDRPAVDADNSAKNVRDRGDETLTAEDQGESADDRKVTQAIRKALVEGPGDYSLSAKNIKIITENGKVTLRGPVRTEAEKAAIETLAKSIAGEGNLDNQIEVKR